MPFTATQNRAFFEDATLAQLANEGISDAEDLSDFDSNSLKQIAANLCRPGGAIPPQSGVGTVLPWE